MSFSNDPKLAADLIVSSFYCEHCQYRNNEVQSGGQLQARGETMKLTVESADDLDRQVVKSEHCSVMLPDLELEIPAKTQRSVITTVQGILSTAADQLDEEQPVRRALDKEIAEKIDAVVAKLRDHANGNVFPFTFIIDDPSGNSYIENKIAPKADPQLVVTKYEQTKEQLHAMGFFEEQGESTAETTIESKDVEKRGADLPAELQAQNKVWDLAAPLNDENTGKNFTFMFPCPYCGKDGEQNMCEIDIPGFRKCMIMAFVCDFCGARNNEVKAAGAYGEKGRKWVLRVQSEEDLNRDILKSDNASIELPDFDCKLEAGTLGGVFTTVEGLLLKIADEIADKFPFLGDAAVADRKQRVEALITNLKDAAAGKGFPFTLIMDDAADHSHIGRRGGETLLFITTNPAAAQKAFEEQESTEDLQLVSTRTL